MPTKKIFKKKFLSILLFVGTFTSFFKGKKAKRSQKNSRNQGFSYYFCLMIEGSGTGSGSTPLTNGSGSGSRRPKNAWIRTRIRIRNTDRISSQIRIGSDPHHFAGYGSRSAGIGIQGTTRPIRIAISFKQMYFFLLLWKFQYTIHKNLNHDTLPLTRK